MRTLYLLAVVSMLSVLPAAAGDDDLKKKIKALEEDNRDLARRVSALESRLAMLEKKLNLGVQERREEESRDRREYSRDRAADTFMFFFKDGSTMPVISYEIKTEKDNSNMFFSKEKKFYYITMENGEVAKTEVDNVKEIRRVDLKRN